MVEAEDWLKIALWCPCACPGPAAVTRGDPQAALSGEPVRAIYLKSWRIQATTGTAAEFFHATAFSPGVHTVVLAHDGPATEKIFTIHRRFQGSTDL